jgi:4'-phosphopantetheinyl transferase
MILLTKTYNYPTIQWVKMTIRLMPIELLEPFHVHMWYAYLPQHDDGLSHNLMNLLTAHERQQQGKFLFENDKHRYLITRALVRTVLSFYAPIDSKDWAFAPGQFGRPRITNNHPMAKRICFNISHTDGLVVLAVTTGCEIGVDTENTNQSAPLEVADSFFSPDEAQALRALPREDQPYRFWELWTFKESYIKARGMGLSLPLDQCSFHFQNETSVTVKFNEGMEQARRNWRFWQLSPDSQHLVAVCLEKTYLEPVEFSHRSIRPLDIVWPLAVSVTRESRLCCSKSSFS